MFNYMKRNLILTKPGLKMKNIVLLAICCIFCGCSINKTVSVYDGATELSLRLAPISNGYVRMMWNNKIKDHVVLTLGSYNPIRSGPSLRFKSGGKEYVFTSIDQRSKPTDRDNYEIRYYIPVSDLRVIFSDRNTLFRYEHDRSYSEGCFCNIDDITWSIYAEYLEEIAGELKKSQQGT